jgi:hypothetical protein
MRAKIQDEISSDISENRSIPSSENMNEMK